MDKRQWKLNKANLVFFLVLTTLLLLWPHTSTFAARKFEGQTIYLQTWGGRIDQMVRKHIIEPFEKETGAKIVAEFGWTSASIAKLRAQKNDPKFDVVMFDDIGVLTAGREGLLEPLNFDRIPNGKDIPSKFIIENNMGIGFYVYITSLSYSKKHYTQAPTSWQLLWDPKNKGRVVLPPIDSSSIYKGFL